MNSRVLGRKDATAENNADDFEKIAWMNELVLEVMFGTLTLSMKHYEMK